MKAQIIWIELCRPAMTVREAYTDQEVALGLRLIPDWWRATNIVYQPPEEGDRETRL